MNDTIPSCQVDGSLIFDGQEIAEYDPVYLSSHIGMVFQKPNPFPKSIYENVAYGPQIHGMFQHKAELDEIVEYKPDDYPTIVEEDDDNIKNVHEIINGNEGIDLILLPRINTVDGITEDHCRAYGYKLNEDGWINFPDWQGRIFRNRPNIRWQYKVHEMITGYKTYATLPIDKPFCILHPKTIEKQVEQNKFYNEDINGINR